MKRLLPLALLFLPAVLRADDKPAEHWLVVTAPAFRKAVEPLAELRKAQGMRVTILETTDVLTKDEILKGDVAKLRERTRKLCGEAKGTCYVLLVGALERGQLVDPETKLLPPLAGTVGRMKDQPSDNGFGCQGKDLLPTAAVGRLPATSAEEARQMVQKILDFERDGKPGAWRQRLTVLAGAPEFNPFVDSLVEKVALSRLDRLDPCWQGRCIFHNQQSRFCLPDPDVHDRAVAYLQEGQAIILHLGHANETGFFTGRQAYLDRDDWSRIKLPTGSIFTTFGCKGCQLTGKTGAGYGVAAIRNPRGPVAVVGSHGICFAAMVQLAADGFFESCLTGQPCERLGCAWLRIKQNVARGDINPLIFKALDLADGDTSIPQATQRLEHLEMFLLLGDPALRLPAGPEKVRLQVAGNAAPGKTVAVSGGVPAALEGAQVEVTLERPAASLPTELAKLPEKPGPERDRAMVANHQCANQFVLVKRQATVKDGKFKVEIALPEKLAWPSLILRAYASGAKQHALGVERLKVEGAGK